MWITCISDVLMNWLCNLQGHQSKSDLINLNVLYLPSHGSVEVSVFLARYGDICCVKDSLPRHLAHAKMVDWDFYLSNRLPASLLKH